MNNLEAAARIIDLAAQHKHYSDEDYSDAVALAVAALSRMADIWEGKRDG